MLNGSCRRFGGAYCLHLQGINRPEDGDRKLLQNQSYCLPMDTVLYILENFNLQLYCVVRHRSSQTQPKMTFHSWLLSRARLGKYIFHSFLKQLKHL